MYYSLHEGHPHDNQTSIVNTTPRRRKGTLLLKQLSRDGKVTRQRYQQLLLVATEKLVSAYFSIDEVFLTLSSKGIYTYMLIHVLYMLIHVLYMCIHVLYMCIHVLYMCIHVLYMCTHMHMYIQLCACENNIPITYVHGLMYMNDDIIVPLLDRQDYCTQFVTHISCICNAYWIQHVHVCTYRCTCVHVYMWMYVGQCTVCDESLHSTRRSTYHRAQSAWSQAPLSQETSRH